MDELLKLAHDSLVELGRVAPEVLGRLVEYWVWRKTIQLQWGVGLTIVGGLLVIGAIIAFVLRRDGYDDWPHALLWPGIVAGLLGTGLWVGAIFKLRMLAAAPEVTILRWLLSAQ